MVMKKNCAYLVSTLFLLIVVGCSSNGTIDNRNNLISSYSNGSGYKWRIYESNKTLNDSFWIDIKVRENTGDLLKDGTRILTACEKLNLENGKITLKLAKSDVERQLRAVSVGYFIVETRPYLFQANDSVVIDFILSEDDRPIINCE